MQDIIITEHQTNAGKIIEITLNRPSKLNACTLEMSRTCQEILLKSADDPKIIALMIKGAGERAFCAGGDLRSLVEADDPKQQAEAFFDLEYDTIVALKNFPKPFIAFWDGITMGGGAGLSLYGSHRIASEHLVFAMPENKIGFFPDVGTCTVFATMPDNFGTYIALTGAHLNPADSLQLNLATHYCPRAEQENLRDAILTADYTQDARVVIDKICNKYNHTPTMPTTVIQQKKIITECFAYNSIAEIYSALKQQNSKFAEHTITQLDLCCPQSLEMTLEHLRTVPGQSFEQAMRSEKQIAQLFVASGSFMRGIEAVIINKKPARWI